MQQITFCVIFKATNIWSQVNDVSINSARWVGGIFSCFWLWGPCRRTWQVQFQCRSNPGPGQGYVSFYQPSCLREWYLRDVDQSRRCHSRWTWWFQEGEPPVPKKWENMSWSSFRCFALKLTAWIAMPPMALAMMRSNMMMQKPHVVVVTSQS